MPKLEVYDFIFFAIFLDYKLKYFLSNEKYVDKSYDYLPKQIFDLPFYFTKQ
jgi:hypothetical protein